MAEAKPRKKPGPTMGPAGRTKRLITTEARFVGPEMLKILISIARDKKASNKERIVAANAVLDRGYGKPTQEVDIGGEVKVRSLGDFYARLEDQLGSENPLLEGPEEDDDRPPIDADFEVIET